jgi:CBS domain-containing protein
MKPRDRLHGMITDRDIAVRCLAEGRDPTTVTASELAQETTYWIRADADENDVLATVEEHQIRRLPVLDEHRLVGFISEADLARQLPADRVAEFTTRVYAVG